MSKELSIIVPVYNDEKYILNCAKSILIQNNIQNYEIIFVNDGSIDGSFHILNQLSKQYPNVQVYSQENRGVSTARNLGLKMATGKFVTFVDSDDMVGISYKSIEHYFNNQKTKSKNADGLMISKRILDSDFSINYSFDKNYFTNMLQSAWGHDADVALAGKFTINREAGYIKQHVYHESKLYDDSQSDKITLVGHAERRENANFALYKKDFLEKNNLKFQTEMKLDEDIIFCIQSVLLANKVVTVADATYLYNRHSNTLSNFTKHYERNYKYTIANIQRFSGLLYLVKDSEKYDSLFKSWMSEFASLRTEFNTHSFPAPICQTCPSATCNDCYAKYAMVEKIKQNIQDYLPGYLLKDKIFG